MTGARASSSAGSPSGAGPPSGASPPLRGDWLANDGDFWELPLDKVEGARCREFVRLTELQVELKHQLVSLLHFAQRDFVALVKEAPEYAADCADLGERDLAESIKKLVPRFEHLRDRIRQQEKLHMVFMGPLKAGKSTLINMLLTSQLGKGSYEMLLPTGDLAATNCIWKVESCDGTTAVAMEGDSILQQWNLDVSDAKALVDARREIACFLHQNLDRHARPDNRLEVLLKLPLAMLNPFGCHYCLVDTPGYTESAEYEILVKDFLEDHSHIACFVCPMTEGTPIPQSAKDMLQRSFSKKTFWVLTRYDELLNRRPMNGAKQPDAADVVAQKFTEVIKGTDPHAKVFKHAASVLMPCPDFPIPAEKFLPMEVAASWLEDIRATVKENFTMIQREQYVLSSQVRHCVDLASALMDEYNKLKDGAHGKQAASDFYVYELQMVVEDTSQKMAREIQQEIKTVQTEVLECKCKEAASKVLSSGHFCAQLSFFDALAASLMPKIEEELQTRIVMVGARAEGRLLEAVRKLKKTTGEECSDRSEAAKHLGLVAPGSEHLRARYPGESLAMMAVTSGGVGASLLSEGGVVLLGNLGLRVGGFALLGWVGVAVASFATMGLVFRHLAEAQPFWSYQQVERDLVERIRSSNNWGILVEACCGRGEAHLLSCAAKIRCAFSKDLLNRGTPRDVLVALFPDLPLFEKIHEGLDKTRSDIEEFVEAQDLARRAPDDLQVCESAVKLKNWKQAIEATSVYVGPNARTDTVPGRDLARLYQLRCEALSRASMPVEVRHSAGVFLRAFPLLSLPRVYESAAGIFSDFCSGSLDADGALREARGLAEGIEGEAGAREVPRLVEIWFLAIGASFLGDAGRAEFSPRLENAVGNFMATHMKQRPSFETIWDEKRKDICERVMAVQGALSDDILSYFRSYIGPHMPPPQGSKDAATVHEEIQEEYRRRCDVYAVGVVNSIHLLLAALPPSQVDMNYVGPRVVDSVLAQVALQLTQPTAMPSEVERHIRSALCPVDEGFVEDLAEEWVRLMGTSLRGRSVHSPRAYEAGVSIE